MADRTTEQRNLSWEQICKLAESEDGINAKVWLDAATRHVENQRREIARLRPDAERYRWLRDHPNSTWEHLYLKPYRLRIELPFESLDRVPASLDVAIAHAQSLEKARG